MVMTINNWFFQPVLNTIGNRLLPAIPEQQKKILIIVLLVLGIYAIYQVVKFCRFKAEPIADASDQVSEQANQRLEHAIQTDTRTPDSSSGEFDVRDGAWSSMGKEDSSDSLRDISTPFGTPPRVSGSLDHLRHPHSLNSSPDIKSYRGFRSLYHIFPRGIQKSDK